MAEHHMPPLAVAAATAASYFRPMARGRSNEDAMTIVRTIPAVFLALLWATQAGRSAPAGNDVNLVPHRAVYDLKLASSHGQRAVEGVRGRIVYDFSGSACEGYSLQFRQVSELDSGEGKVALSDLRASSYEEGNAGSLRFSSQNYLNDNQSEIVDGRAERGPDGVSVTLTKPKEITFRLEASMVFPTEQIRRVITAARNGESILELPVYDGSENGEKVYNTLSVIGRPIKPTERMPTDAAAGQAPLAGLTRWPVTISYFDRSALTHTGEQTPVYAIGFELYENGVSRALSLDYGDFTVAGEMTSLEFKEIKPCK
jgi:EipB-like